MDNLMWFVPISAILGVVVIVAVSSVARARVREMEVRERIAMIERGLVPAPETDPGGFDRAMGRYERIRDQYDRRGYRTHRYRRAGITMMGLGFGFMFMLGFLTGEPRVGLGVGGFLAILGGAFFLNSLLEPDAPEVPPPSESPKAPTPRSN